MVRCAVCRKGALSRKTAYARGGDPGDAFIRSVLDQVATFSCGHTVFEHKKLSGDPD